MIRVALPALVVLTMLGFMRPSVLAAPVAHCDQPTFVYGQLPNTEKVRHVFVIENRGDALLEIRSVQPGCGCTVAEVSLKAVPPGASTRVETVLDLTGRKGPQNKHIAVYTNDPAAPIYYLKMEGSAVAEVDVQPSSVFMGNVPVSGETTQAIDIQAMDGVTFKVSTINVPSNRFTAQLETVNEGTHYRVTVRPHPDQLKPGQINDSLRIETDHPRYAVLTVPLFAQVQDVVSVLPDTMLLQLFEGRPASAITRYLRIQPGTAEKFELRGVEWPEKEAKVIVTHQGAAGWLVAIRNLVPASELDGKHVLIKTSIPGREEIRIPIRVMTIPQPSVAP